MELTECKKGNEVLIYLQNAFKYYIKNGLLTRYEGDQLLALFHSKEKIDVDRIENNLNKIMEEAPIPNIRVKLGIYEKCRYKSSMQSCVIVH